MTVLLLLWFDQAKKKPIKYKYIFIDFIARFKHNHLKMSKFSLFNGNDEDEHETEQKYAHLMSG